jgi:hypothetical protein
VSRNRSSLFPGNSRFTGSGWPEEVPVQTRLDHKTFASCQRFQRREPAPMPKGSRAPRHSLNSAPGLGCLAAFGSQRYFRKFIRPVTSKDPCRGKGFQDADDTRSKNSFGRRNTATATHPGPLSAPTAPAHPSTAARSCTSSELSNTYRSGGSMTTSRTPPSADGSSSSPPSLLSPCEQGAHETTRRRHNGKTPRTEVDCPRTHRRGTGTPPIQPAESRFPTTLRRDGGNSVTEPRPVTVTGFRSMGCYRR